jgi:hypothetical protein
MSQTLLEMAKDLVLAQIHVHRLSPEDMHTALQAVTVQVVKTGITPQLAPAERLWGVETVPLHPAGQLHTLR